MIHARARCWIHEDCLGDFELSSACGPNPPDVQVLDGGWAEAADGYGYGYGYGNGYGNGYGEGGDGFGGWGDGDGDGDGDGYCDGDGGYGYGDGGEVEGGQR